MNSVVYSVYHLVWCVVCSVGGTNVRTCVILMSNPLFLRPFLPPSSSLHPLTFSRIVRAVRRIGGGQGQPLRTGGLRQRHFLPGEKIAQLLCEL